MRVCVFKTGSCMYYSNCTCTALENDNWNTFRRKMDENKRWFFLVSQRMIFTMQQTNCTNECATNKETWRKRRKNEQLHSFAFQKMVCNETFCPLANFFLPFFGMHFWVTIFSSCGILLRYIKKLRFNLNTKWWRVFFARSRKEYEVFTFYR